MEEAGRKIFYNWSSWRKGKSLTRKTEKESKKSRRNTLKRKNVFVLKNSPYLHCWDERQST
jgi:hypothetical protein